MTEPVTREVSALLRRDREALAASAVARQYAAQGERWAAFGAEGRAKSLRDMGYHLDYLAEALAVSDPVLFTEYIAWVKVLFAGLGFPDVVISNTLLALRDTVQELVPDDVATVALVYLDAGLAKVATASVELPSLIDAQAPHAELAQRYLSRLLEGDRRGASRLILSAVDDGVSIPEIYIHVFQTTQREVGRLWQTNRISVAQEHFCTAATQLIMSQLYPYIFGGDRKDLRFVGTCVGGELHEMGVRMVADFFEMDGWDTYYLGANTPPEAVVNAVQERRADVVGISATMTFHTRRTAELIDRLRATDGGSDLVILVGGYPFNLSSRLWEEIGADGYAPGAQEAVAVALDLVGA